MRGQLAGQDAVDDELAFLDRSLRDEEIVVVAVHSDHDDAEAVLEGLVGGDEEDEREAAVFKRQIQELEDKRQQLRQARDRLGDVVDADPDAEAEAEDAAKKSEGETS